MRYLKIKVSGILKYLKANGDTPSKDVEFKLRMDDEIPALGSLVGVRPAIALLQQ